MKEFFSLSIEDLELDVETIDITPAIDLSDFSDAQDLPETGASIGSNSCSAVITKDN